MKKVYFLLIINLLVININLADNFDIGGSYKIYNNYIPEYSDTKTSESIVEQTFRINSEYRFSDKFKIDFDYELTGLSQSNYIFGYKMLNESYRIDDFQKKLFPDKENDIGNFQFIQNLDRFYFSYYFSFADIYIGRQAVNWGSSRIINPTDILLSYNFNKINSEYRIGVDAVRLRIPFGMMNEVDIGAVAGKDFDNDKSVYYGRLKYYYKQSDIFLLIMKFKNHLLYGFDLTRSIGKAGSWLEAAYVEVDKFLDSNSSEKDYFRLTLGMDYNLTSKLYTVFEYHYNGAGETKRVDYMKNLDKSAYIDGNVFLMSKNYINIISTYQVTGLINSSTTVLYNLDDNSMSIIPSVEYNIKEDLYISAGCNLYINLKNKEIKSEFDYYENSLYTGIRVYF